MQRTTTLERQLQASDSRTLGVGAQSASTGLRPPHWDGLPSQEGVYLSVLTIDDPYVQGMRKGGLYKIRANTEKNVLEICNDGENGRLVKNLDKSNYGGRSQI